MKSKKTNAAIRKPLTHKQVAKLAQRIFNGESQAKIAKAHGLTSAQLDKLIAKADKAGAFTYG